MSEPHLNEQDIAAYVDGTTSADRRALLDAHLAACAECRAEVSDVERVTASYPVVHRPAWRAWAPAVAAAAAAVLLVVTIAPEGDDAVHREEAVTMTVAPRALAPAGVVDSVDVLVWSSVPRADRYRVRLFDGEGTVLVEREVADTVLPVPSGMELPARRSYFWRVEAHTGFDRWSPSELVEFTPRDGTER